MSILTVIENERARMLRHPEGTAQYYLHAFNCAVFVRVWRQVETLRAVK